MCPTSRADKPIRDRRAFIGTAASGLLAAAFSAFGQQLLPKVYRIGYLGTQRASDYKERLERLQTNLRELGCVENRNIVIELRSAEGREDRLPELAAELVALKVDVIVTEGPLSALIAQHVTATTPIVVGNVGDAVKSGLVASFAKPGRNIRGMSFLADELESAFSTVERRGIDAILVHTDALFYARGGSIAALSGASFL